ncbi:MAG: GAF domain-containing protein [Rikenellaceae bacterium]
MAEDIYIPSNATKTEIFEALLPQIFSFTQYETSRAASLGNVTAIIKEAFNLFWVGFYLVEQDKLVLNAFQGPVACTRIFYGKGVCGTSWQREQTIVVEDVDKFEGHIACSSSSKSEIVIPLKKRGKVLGVLDIDSDTLATFDSIDKKYYEKICDIIVENCF